jgi:hypothetical protein
MTRQPAPFFAPLVERLAAPPPPAAVSSPPLGAVELLSLAEKIKGLVAPPEPNLRREVRDAFREGIEIGRERASESGTGSAWSPEGVATVISTAGPFIHDALNRFRPNPGTPALPGAPGASPGAPDRGQPMAANPVFSEIIEAVITELKAPKETRDVPGVAAFLGSIVIGAEGTTLYDRLASVAHSPERLARLSLRVIDQRLADASVWDGMSELLAYVREQTKADRRDVTAHG